MSKINIVPYEDFWAPLRENTRAVAEKAARRVGGTAFVLITNLQMDSSRFGEYSILIVGPHCTYKSVDDVACLHLGDLPSERKYPMSATEIDPEVL